MKEENLNLKQERQQLLERVAGFESKVQERQTQHPVVVGVGQKFEHIPFIFDGSESSRWHILYFIKCCKQTSSLSYAINVHLLLL